MNFKFNRKPLKEGYDIIKKYEYDGQTYGLMKDGFKGSYFGALIDNKGNIKGNTVPFDSLKAGEEYFSVATEVTNESLKEGYYYFETDEAIYQISDGKHLMHLKAWDDKPGFEYYDREISPRDYIDAYRKYSNPHIYESLKEDTVKQNNGKYNRVVKKFNSLEGAREFKSKLPKEAEARIDYFDTENKDGSVSEWWEVCYWKNRLKEDISDYEIDKVYKKLSKLNKVDFGALEDEYLKTRPSLKDAVYKFYGTILNTKSYCKDFIQWVKEEKGIDLKGLPCKESLQRRINESPDEYGILYDSEVDNKYKEIASKEKDENRKYRSRIIEYKRQILKRLPEIQEMINDCNGEYYSFDIDYNSATCHVNPNYIEIYTYVGRAPMIKFDLVVTKDGDIKGSADGGVGWTVSSRDISYAYSLFNEYFDTFKEEFYKKLSSQR